MTLQERLQWNQKLKDKFKDVTFTEEGHKYTIKGFEDKPIKSVSSLLKLLYDEFDTNAIAPKYAEARGFSEEQVKLAWEGEGTISTTHGSRVHLIGEQYALHKFLGIGECPLPIDKQSLGAIQFINDLPDYLVPIGFELSMYNIPLWYVGTADLILLNTKTGKLIIADYKTNKELFDNSKDPLKLVSPESGLKQDNYGKYSSQFSFYQILLEEAGFEVGGRVLVWLRENPKKWEKKLYQTFQTPNITEDLRNILFKGLHLN